VYGVNYIFESVFCGVVFRIIGMEKNIYKKCYDILKKTDKISED